LEFENSALMKHNNILNIIDERTNVFENEDPNVALKYENEIMDMDEVKDHNSQKNVKW